MANSDKSRYWSVTINNPQPEDEREMAMARQKGWTVDGQLEQGEEGTPHYQLIVDCKTQQRFSAIKKAFARGHIEKARNVDALKAYVHKSDTKVADLTTKSAQYPSQEEVWSHWASFVDDQVKEKGITAVRKRVHDSGLLPLWDDYIHAMISAGYFVELIGVNPQIRSCVKTYGLSILHRCGVHLWSPSQRIWTPGTDRQTDTDVGVAADIELKINIPMEHNQDADAETELSQEA